jgi:hypothetical protein
MNLTLPPNKGNSTPTTATPTAPLNSANLMKLNIPPAAGGSTTAVQSDTPTDRKNEQSLPKRPSLPTATDLPAPESIKSSPQAGTPTADASKNPEDAEPRTAGVVSETADTPRVARDEETLRDKLMRSMGPRYTSVEEFRLDQAEHYEKHWRRWGPYLSERQWVSACVRFSDEFGGADSVATQGTVREDYSANGDAWNSFNFDQSRSRAYRWGEDGIGGIS